MEVIRSFVPRLFFLRGEELPGKLEIQFGVTPSVRPLFGPKPKKTLDTKL